MPDESACDKAAPSWPDKTSIWTGTAAAAFTFQHAIPSVLKAWIDQILRVGRTMMSTPAGKVGMLRDRPVFIGVASGAIFTGDRANQPDFLTPYLTLALNSIGLEALQFLPIQATAFLGNDQAAMARETALAAIDLTVIRELKGLHSCSAVPSGASRPYHESMAQAFCASES